MRVRSLIGPGGGDILRSMETLALTHWAQDRMGAATTLQEEVLEEAKRILGLATDPGLGSSGYKDINPQRTEHRVKSNWLLR